MESGLTFDLNTIANIVQAVFVLGVAAAGVWLFRRNGGEGGDGRTLKLLEDQLERFDRREENIASILRSQNDMLMTQRELVGELRRQNGTMESLAHSTERLVDRFERHLDRQAR